MNMGHVCKAHGADRRGLNSVPACVCSQMSSYSENTRAQRTERRCPRHPFRSPWCQYLHAADRQAVTLVCLCVGNSGEWRGQVWRGTEGAAGSPQDGERRETVHWSGERAGLHNP